MAGFKKDERRRHLQRDMGIPLEVSYYHLLIITPSHLALRKAGGLVAVFLVKEEIPRLNGSRAVNSVNRNLSEFCPNGNL